MGGTVPNTWQIKKLGEVCDLIRGSEPGSASYFNKPSENCVQFIRVGDITGKVDNPKFVNKKLNNLTIVNLNDVLISFDGTPGVVVKGWNGVISSGIRVIRNVKPDILKGFLFYYLQTPNVQQIIKFYTTGVTILHASRAIPHIKIPLPPLPVQKAIVERLDAIKKAQELNDKQIALADELFQSLLHKELDPKGKNWEIKKLREICDKIQQTHPQKNFKDKFRYIDIESIDSKTNTITEVKTIKVEKAPSRARKLIKEGDTIFATTRPYLRNIAYISQEFDNCIASTGFCVIRGKRDLVEPKFLFFLSLSKAFISRVLTYQRGASYPAVSDSNIYNLKISLPSLSIQRQIAQKLQVVQEYKKKLIEQKQKLKELFESCLNKAMKGKLVV